MADADSETDSALDLSGDNRPYARPKPLRASDTGLGGGFIEKRQRSLCMSLGAGGSVDNEPWPPKRVSQRTTPQIRFSVQCLTASKDG